MQRILNIQKVLFFLCFISVTGCWPARHLPQPEVKPPDLSYSGEISAITTPIVLKNLPVENIYLYSKVQQIRDDQKLKAIQIHEAWGGISLSEVSTERLEMNLYFEEATYDEKKLADAYDISGKITYDSNSGRLGIVSIHAYEKEKFDLGVKDLENRLEFHIENWIPYILRLPDGPIKTGTPINWTDIFSSTGREFIPWLYVKLDNSVILGMTSYKDKDHVVLSLNVICERIGDVDKLIGGAIYPITYHLAGYILVDKETGLHSLGNLKTRLAVRRFTGTDYYWITNKFSVDAK